MKKYLIFYLYGPLYAWGVPGTIGEIRASDKKMSKSAIIGLLASSLGIKRNNEEYIQLLQNTFDFSVRIEARGIKIVDFHSIQVPSESAIKNIAVHTRRQELSVDNLETILSSDEYYCDIWYTCAFCYKENKNEIELETFLKSLRNPVFIPYLGKKSCSLGIPIIPEIFHANYLEDAFDQYDNLSSSKQIRKLLKPIPSLKKSFIYADMNVPLKNTQGYQQVTVIRDNILSRTRGQFSERQEKFIVGG